MEDTEIIIGNVYCNTRDGMIYVAIDILDLEFGEYRLLKGKKPYFKLNTEMFPVEKLLDEKECFLFKVSGQLPKDICQRESPKQYTFDLKSGTWILTPRSK